MRRAGSLAVIAALSAALCGPAWARIGVTSVTDGATSVTQGSDLQAGQRISTSADGRVHLMFLDGSALTLGPGSTVTIDSYSYDPSRRTGEMSISVARGTIRCVGGVISKTTDIEIRTPSSMIGLRGGIGTVSVSDSGATTANFLHGSAMRVTGLGTTVTATRTGSQITVAPGGHATRAVVLTAGQLVGLQSLDRGVGRAGQPSMIDEALAKSGLSQHNSGVVGQQAVLAQGQRVLTTGSAVQVEAVQNSQQLVTLERVAKSAAVPMAATPAPLGAAVQSPPTIPAAAPAPAVAPATPVATAAAPQAGSGTVVKAGAGTLTLSGTGTHTGATVISPGTLNLRPGGSSPR